MNKMLSKLMAVFAALILFCGVSLLGNGTVRSAAAETDGAAADRIDIERKIDAENVYPEEDISELIRKAREERKRTASKAAPAPVAPSEEESLPAPSNDDLPVTGARAGLTSIAAFLFAAAFIVAKKKK